MTNTARSEHPNTYKTNPDLYLASSMADELMKVRDTSELTEILTHHNGIQISNGRILCVLVDKTCYKQIKLIRVNYPEHQVKSLLAEITDPNFYMGLDDSKCVVNLKHTKCNTVFYGLSRLSEKNVSFFSFYKPAKENIRNLSLFKILAPFLHAALNNIYDLEALIHRDPINISTREIEVLKWVSKGKTNKQIGIILNLSCFTIKNHMANILSKLNVANRAQAIDKVINLGYFN